MTTSTYTPGPWIVNGRAIHTDGRNPDGGVNIATLHGRHKVHGPNGYLIAAAPEMLAALIAMQDLVDLSAPQQIGSEAYNRAGVAIARARGEV